MPVYKATGITPVKPLASDALGQARAAAERLLRVRPRSEQEMRQRLRQKGFAPPVMDAVVQELTRRGFLNDQQFARLLATSQLLSKPTGLRAVREALRRKGVEPAVAEQALGLAAADYDELAAARDLAQRRAGPLKGLPAATIQRRLFGVLQRRGFSSEIVYKVVREFTQRGIIDESS